MSVDQMLMNQIVNNLKNTDAEEVVLGAILLEKNLFYSVSEDLFEDLFTSVENRYIFRAINDLANDVGKEIETITVWDRMRTAGYNQMIKKTVPNFGGPGYVASLTNKIASTANIYHHIGILHRYWQLRKINALNFRVGQMCSSENEPDDILEHINKELVNITAQDPEEFNKEESIQDALDSMSKTSVSNIIRTGIHPLDEFIYGFEEGDLIVLAGAASMGKTAAALRLFRNWIEADQKPVYFSREMSARQLTSRLIAMEADVSLSRIRRRDLYDRDWDKINQQAKILQEKTYTIDDKTSDLFKMASKIRKHAMSNGTKVFIVDYLQLVTVNLGKNVNREREVATITRTFKELCTEFNIVIIALSQLSREVGKRGDHRPKLSDLRESGAIEQDADMVIFPYRPAYYDVHNRSIPVIEDDAIWIIAKGRGTGLKDIPMKFKSSITNYTNGYPLGDELDFETRENLSADF